MTQPIEVSLLGLEHGGEELTVVWRHKQKLSSREKKENNPNLSEFSFHLAKFLTLQSPNDPS